MTEPPRLLTPGTGDLLARKYLLAEEIGRGSAGIVFRAKDTYMLRDVAVKILPLEGAMPEQRLPERMRREVVIYGRLDHPNIVRVHDAGADGSVMYLVMELIGGRTLRVILTEKGCLPHEESLAIAIQILEALACAHEQGIVHRDLKPENVLLHPDGTVKVTDFGLGKLYSEVLAGDAPHELRVTLTADGSAIGTPAYMAPEQFLGLGLDHRVDLFAAGALLYEMLGGVTLASMVSPLMMASSLHPGRNSVNLPTMPGDARLGAILHRALAVRREDRYPSCTEFIKALRNVEHPGWTGRLRHLFKGIR